MVASIPIEQASSYIDELRTDKAIVAHYQSARARSRIKADPLPLWGRRLGWYALTRALKPRLIVETGVHFGLGALAFTSALMRNSAEGHPGRYIGLEILPQFGWLLAGPYAEFGEVRHGKSLDLLVGIDGGVDLFVHDSDHSIDHEMSELRLIEPRLSSTGVLLSDNSHTSPALYNFALETGRRFLHFQEISVLHFYAGAGFGAAWR
jgi:predicted O-methyltransferase YrrM